MDNYSNDKQYWDAFYVKENKDIAGNTLFAEFVFNKWVKNRMTLLECGCGNGRDSLYFAQKGLHVTGVDASVAAIESISHKYQNCDFVCEDFVNTDKIYKKKYDICYSRFSLHAIRLKQELVLHQRVYEALNQNGIFCIEARSIHDELYGKGKLVERNAYIYNDHYRRFIKMDELIVLLIKTGFTIKYAEENTGFAPFDGYDPYIIRVIAQKE